MIKKDHDSIRISALVQSRSRTCSSSLSFSKSQAMKVRDTSMRIHIGVKTKKESGSLRPGACATISSLKTRRVSLMKTEKFRHYSPTFVLLDRKKRNHLALTV